MTTGAMPEPILDHDGNGYARYARTELDERYAELLDSIEDGNLRIELDEAL